MRFYSFIAIILACGASFAEARIQAKPLALVYLGPGSCNAEEDDAGEHEFGCSEAAAVVARKAGYRVKFVGPDDLSDSPDLSPDSSVPSDTTSHAVQKIAAPKLSPEQEVKAVFEDAKVWIQPGGVAMTAYDAMSSRLKIAIVDFVRKGGGYVGWCAGAIMATERIGETRYGGLGIFPGKTLMFSTDTEKPELDYSMQELTWLGKKRFVYYEGGPHLAEYGEDAHVKEIATYETGEIAAARAPFGRGRVFLSGPHPEAPSIWSEEDKIKDPDGPDLDLAVQMVRWAGRYGH